MTFDTRLLLEHLRTQYQLDWHGIHGISHWMRVRRTGLKLARQTGADRQVVELFAFLHDSCRWNENHDPQHGSRAAELARTLHGRLFSLSLENLERLTDACAGHTDEATHTDITIATCWDADRLDLGRVGIEPDPKRLCTDAAKRLAISSPHSLY